MVVLQTKYRMKKKVAERFWEKVDRPETGCWNWQASTRDDGYGEFGIGSKVYLAHRVAWALTNGDPGDDHVLHHCDNPPCVRPSHLFSGSHLDNMRDAQRKGKLANELKERCKRGHEFTPENTYHWNNARQCRACKAIKMREYRSRR